MLVGARHLHPPLGLRPPPRVTRLMPAGTGTAGRRAGPPCPVPHCPVPAGAASQRGCPASPGCPCAPAVSPALSPCAGSGVAAAVPGEGPCRRLPCGAGIHQLRGSGSIYNQEALACRRATLGCAGCGQNVPWATRPNASAVTEGVAGCWDPLSLFGVLLQRCRGALGWRSCVAPAACAQSPPPAPMGTPVPQGPPWQCQPLGGGRAAVPAGAGWGGWGG